MVGRVADHTLRDYETPEDERWNMTKSSPMLKGIIRGRVIELESESGLPDGQEVSVTVEVMRTVTATSLTEADSQRRLAEALAQVENLAPGEGLRLGFGAWAEDAEELDEYLESSRKLRKLGRQGMES